MLGFQTIGIESRPPIMVPDEKQKAHLRVARFGRQTRWLVPAGSDRSALWALRSFSSALDIAVNPMSNTGFSAPEHVRIALELSKILLTCFCPRAVFTVRLGESRRLRFENREETDSPGTLNSRRKVSALYCYRYFPHIIQRSSSTRRDVFSSLKEE